MENKKKIVISGGGVLSNMGVGLEQFWNSLVNNEKGITIREEWNMPEVGAQYFGKCPDFNFKEHFENIRPPFPLKYSQMAMVGCNLAIKDAGLEVNDGNAERLGLLIDTSFGASSAVQGFLVKLFEEGPGKVSPFNFTKTTVNCALGDVARNFGLKGPSSMLMGENTVCYGFDLLQDGKADVIICGGFDEIIDVPVIAHDKRNYLIPPVKNGVQVPFEENLSEERGKIVFGEASAFVVLETLEHAQARGAKIYAELVDYTVIGDTSYDDFLYQRSNEDLDYSMTSLLERTEIDKENVGLVVGGACLPWHIRDFEASVIKNIWKDSSVYYTTVKGKTGETFSSSPIISLLTGAMCLSENAVTGTGYSPEVLKGIAENIHIPETTLHHDSQKPYALVNSLHKGGNTVSIMLKKAA
ncbi:3-oxoacyl-(acyl-carrier-protein) synthase [Pseudarcicella hirudinis]|uniref:3-oxoacyl-(Acyl-carrier-protein) synthase n=1 Tax=Pseudarcicella hirudinis TaxID=1079859 RepID=A0A1I5THL4_9BACT|nr:beta-ketoacyl synthase N-terminal-like domain-containing protein [Pseudarcicella hirudinis]SFP81886.1 3-oxoacyl-(acyl-carrier-protein) synthase [Pseudarcicella hirudinis]